MIGSEMEKFNTNYDNQILDVNGRCLPKLKAALSLTQFDKAVGYHINDARDTLVFFWAFTDECTPFISPIDHNLMAENAFAWLSTATYGEEPDIDGSTVKGWRCFTGSWGHLHKYSWESFVAVKTEWIMIGK